MDEKIIQIIGSVLQVPCGQISESTEIGDLPEWDSLHHIAILVELEKAYNIHFTQDLLADVEDVADLCALVRELSGDKEICLQ